MQQTGRIHIGTSGWHYSHWKGPFYPEDLRPERFLDFYSQIFSTVEVNNTFYGMPDRRTLIHWRDIAPPSFLFSVKASRFITHMKKLKDARRPLTTFLRRIGVFGDRLGPLLFQLPPRWKANSTRLLEFLTLLPKDIRCAFEFRDTSWFTPEIYDILQDAGAGFCVYQFSGTLSPNVVTSDFVYLRLHGPTAVAYRGSYDDRTLGAWAQKLLDWQLEGKDVYCYFDNDEAGYAAQNAMQLKKMIIFRTR